MSAALRSSVPRIRGERLRTDCAIIRAPSPTHLASRPNFPRCSPSTEDVVLRDKYFAVFVTFVVLIGSVSATEVVVRSQGYDRSEAGFAAMGERVLSMHGRNLLARRGVQVFLDGRSAQGRMRELVDAYVGQCGAEGRVFLNGQPTVLTYYLGEAKTIAELGVFLGQRGCSWESGLRDPCGQQQRGSGGTA